MITTFVFLAFLTSTLSKNTITSIHDAVDDYMVKGDLSKYGPIASWDTSGVTDMSGLFFDYYAIKFKDFNEDLSNWDTSNVTNMNFMFYRAEAFNSDISQWNVSQVTDMAGMFHSSKAFNQNVHYWDVGSVKDMYQMFMMASSFNQNLSPWNIAKVTEMSQMFESTAMDQSLCWDMQNVQKHTKMFNTTSSRIECLPTAEPSAYPTQMPSNSPTEEPTESPSVSPTLSPSIVPSFSPNRRPIGEGNGQKKTTDDSAGVSFGWNGWKIMGLFMSLGMSWRFM